MNLKQYLIKSISGIFVLRVAGVVLSIVASIVFARLMGPDEYGRYSFAIETMMFISIPVALGLPQLLTREVSKYNASQDYTHLKGLLRWSGLFSFLAAIVFIGLTALIVSFAEDDPYIKKLFLIALPIIALHGIGQVRMGALRGFKKPIKSQITDSVIRPGLSILFIVTLYILCDTKIDAVKTIISMNLALLVSFVLGLYWLYKTLTENTDKTNIYQYEVKYWTKEALPFFFLGTAAIVNSKLSLILSGFYLQPAEVGYYRIALTASTLVSFFLASVNATISPIVSEMYIKQENKKLNNVLKNLVKIIFFISLIVFIVYVVIGKLLIEFFYGVEYLSAYEPLIVLSFGQLISSGAGPVGTVLTMTGHQTDPLKVNIVAMFINIILCILLIPIFGIIGSATATAFSLIFRNIVSIIYLNKRTKLYTSILLSL